MSTDKLYKDKFKHVVFPLKNQDIQNLVGTEENFLS